MLRLRGFGFEDIVCTIRKGPFAAFAGFGLVLKRLGVRGPRSAVGFSWSASVSGPWGFRGEGSGETIFHSLWFLARKCTGYSLAGGHELVHCCSLASGSSAEGFAKNLTLKPQIPSGLLILGTRSQSPLHQHVQVLIPLVSGARCRL